MAGTQDHIEQWKHNRSLLSAIPAEYPDWIVTVTFYTALHAVDALLAHDRVTVTSHETRNGVLIRTNRYLALNRSYLPLHGLSRTVRYLANPAQWVPRDEVEQNVIRRYLYPIEKSVQNLLGQDLKLPKVSLSAPIAAPPTAAPAPAPSTPPAPSP